MAGWGREAASVGWVMGPGRVEGRRHWGILLRGLYISREGGAGLLYIAWLNEDDE